MARQNPDGKKGEATRDRILAAAETVFAAESYAAASVRKIALGANVPVALVNYHFGSKLGLFRELFKLRAPTVVDQRIAGLQLARMETDPDRRIEMVVKTLVVPMLHLRASAKNSLFGGILAREVSDPSSAERGIFQEMFDPIAELMLEAIGECFPDWTKAEIHWAYHTMLGSMVFVMADSGRIHRLSGGDCDPEDYEEASHHVVAILTAGLKYRDRSRTSKPNKPNLSVKEKS